jgi:hypothetical protein
MEERLEQIKRMQGFNIFDNKMWQRKNMTILGIQWKKVITLQT